MILAEVPLATMFDYANELRSMTQGKGSFSMEFSRYKQVPGSLQDEVVARRRAEKEERLAMARMERPSVGLAVRDLIGAFRLFADPLPVAPGRSSGSRPVSGHSTTAEMIEGAEPQICAEPRCNRIRAGG